MDAKEFREFISKKDNKIEAYLQVYKTAQDGFNAEELMDIIKDEFSTEEKKQILLNCKIVHLLLTTKERKELLISIKSFDDIIEIIKDDKYEFTSSLNKFDISDIIKTFNDEDKIKCLEDEEFKKLYNIDYGTIYNVLSSLDEYSLEKLYDDKEKLASIVGSYNIVDFIENSVSRIQDEDKRFQIANQYELDNSKIAHITAKCSDSKKEEVLLSKKYSFSQIDIVSTLIEFSVDNLAQFIKKHAAFLNENDLSELDIIKECSFDKQIAYLSKYRNDLKFHDIMKISSFDKQVEFIRKIDTFDLSIDEKRKSLIVLNPQVKQQTDIIESLGLKEEYIEALKIPVFLDKNEDIYAENESTVNADLGFIDYDLNADLTKYKGLDELINIRPQRMPPEKLGKLLELAKICPNLNVYDNKGRHAYGYEFVASEEWISEVIKGINPEWNDVQKIAYIDNKIGNRVTYSPDSDTEVYDYEASNTMFKVLSSGYGVCEGIALAEQYILKKIGIDSEVILSDGEKNSEYSKICHAFILLKHIRIPKSDGTYVIGDSLLDPTSNLTMHRYGGMPNYFLLDYNQMIQTDEEIFNNTSLHKTNWLSADSTLNLKGIDKNTLRDIFSSIGLTKENGHPLFEDLYRETGRIGCENLPLEQKIDNLLNYFKEKFPDFDKTQHGTISILSNIVLNHTLMNYKKLIINRVYNKNDDKKRPLVYLWFNLDDEKELFYIAENGDFTQMSREDFVNNYECYKNDLLKTNGIRPWENKNKTIQTDKETPEEKGGDYR